jgi:uncharacterized protein YbaP (TraB family)
MSPISPRFLSRLLAALALLAALPAAALDVTAPKLYLWEVTSLTNRAYLFGTVHAGKESWYPLPAAVEGALADCKVLVVEADVTDTEAMARTASVSVYPPGDSLAKHVDPEDYERFRKLLPRFKIPEESAARYKPFMAASLIVFGEWARLGYQPQFGIDSYLIRRAREAKMRVVEIEGIETQAKLIASLTEEEQRLAFTGTLKAFDMGITAEQITGMLNAWQIGDPGLVLQVAQRYNEQVPGGAAFEEKFVWSRHDEMVRKIEGYLNDGKERHFIAVGALHMAGPRGLVQMLKDRGYVVRQK